MVGFYFPAIVHIFHALPRLYYRTSSILSRAPSHHTSKQDNKQAPPPLDQEHRRHQHRHAHASQGLPALSPPPSAQPQRRRTATQPQQDSARIRLPAGVHNQPATQDANALDITGCRLNIGFDRQFRPYIDNSMCFYRDIRFIVGFICVFIGLSCLMVFL